MSSLVANPIRFTLVFVAKAARANEATLHTVGARARVLFEESFAAPSWLRRGPNFFRQATDENSALGFVCVLYPASSVTASGDNRRPAATRSSASATPPFGLRFPSKSCSPGTPKSFVWTIRKCIASALGSRPHSQGFAQCDPSKLGKFKTETITCTRTKLPSWAF